MGLKTVLNELIKSRGYVTLDEIEKLTDELGYKRSNAERRLRKSESPMVESVKDSKGNIIGYKYTQSDILRRFREAGEKKTVKEIDQEFTKWGKKFTSGHLFDF